MAYSTMETEKCAYRFPALSMIRRHRYWHHFPAPQPGDRKARFFNSLEVPKCSIFALVG